MHVDTEVFNELPYALGSYSYAVGVNWISNTISTDKPVQTPVEIQLSKRKRYLDIVKRVRRVFKYANHSAYLATWFSALQTNDLELITAKFIVSRLSLVPLVQIAYLVEPELQNIMIVYIDQLLRRVSKHTRPNLSRFLKWYLSPYQIPLAPKARVCKSQTRFAHDQLSFY